MEVEKNGVDLYTFRIADVALTAVEPGIDRAPEGLPDIVGRVEVKDVTFRYSGRTAERNRKPS